MSESINNYFLAIAAATPLPSIEGGNRDEAMPTLSRPQPRSLGLLPPLGTRAQVPVAFPQAPATVSDKKKKSKRKSNFTIFVDPDVVNDVPIHTPKKSKKSPRTPLSERTDSANSTPAPSPRASDTPFPFSPADPNWENTENYDMNNIITPPPTPRGPRVVRLPVRTPPPPSSRPERVLGSRRGQASNVLGQPLNMLVYNMLGLDDWKVSHEAIRAAYRQVAFASHPDRAAAKERELATLEMQQINAAKELLLSSSRRRQYHVDGVVPWDV